jgi:hypothetical protein
MVTNPDDVEWAEAEAMNHKIVDRIDTLVHPGAVGGGSADVTQALAPVASEEGFEDAYQKIGWWKGPNAMPEVQAYVRDFWQRQGERGLKWLIGRLRQESHIDLLDGVASILARAGGLAILPILEELERQPQHDQAEALLKALAWMGEDGVRLNPPSLEGLETALSTLLHQDDVGLREWSARAARLFPHERAVELLATHLDAEPDADVRQAIEEIVGASEIGQS